MQKYILLALLAVPALAAPQEQVNPPEEKPEVPGNIEDFPIVTPGNPAETEVPTGRDRFTSEFPNLETFPAITDGPLPTPTDPAEEPENPEQPPAEDDPNVTLPVEPPTETNPDAPPEEDPSSTEDSTGTDSPTATPPEDNAGNKVAASAFAMGLAVWVAISSVF